MYHCEFLTTHFDRMPGNMSKMQAKDCWYGAHCMNDKCRFAHPPRARPSAVESSRPAGVEMSRAQVLALERKQMLDQFWRLFEAKFGRIHARA